VRRADLFEVGTLGATILKPSSVLLIAAPLCGCASGFYEDSGHFVYLDDPERFARNVVEFLR
jgi:pimeloyl-ACP methyl ester carboxylesterase